ncbi:histidine kinase [Lachnospiraceae bacterium oral taxon 500]|nr:histidine kinase [Lachnospiraceae bacterium oral taxon 500]
MNEQLARTLLEYFVLIPAAILCYLPMRKQIRYLLCRLLIMAVLAFLILSVLGSFAEIYFPSDANVILLPVLIGCFTFYVHSIKAPISKAAAIFVNVMAVMSILANFAACFDAAKHPSLGINSASMDYTLFLLAASTILAIPVGFFFGKYGSKLVERLHIANVYLMTLPFSGAILMINLFMRPLKYETFYVNRVGTAVRIILSIVFFIWMVMNVVFYFIVSILLDAAKSEQERKILKIQEKQYDTQMKYISDSARARHDFRQILITLKNMAELGNTDAVNAYLADYMRELPTNETLIYTKNNAVNAVLNFYAAQAKNEGIDVSFSIDIDKWQILSDVELCTMIGNLLENAIDAAKNADDKERFIELTMTTHGGCWLYIVETNGFDGNIKRKSGEYYSTKRNGRGLGIASIKSTVEKYNGQVEFSHDEQEFYVNIAIPLNED